MADEHDAFLNDPLFQRLQTIGREVEQGRADLETVERWEELRDSVTRLLDHLHATLLAATPTDRERVARQWIQAFTDRHWPAPRLH